MDAHPLWKKALSKQLRLPVPVEKSLLSSSVAQRNNTHPLPTASLIKQVTQPKMSNSNKKTSDNAIFQAIADKNEPALKRILSLENQVLAMPAARAVHSSQHNKYPASTGQQHHVSEQLVMEFFNKVNASQLRELIKSSEYTYFVWLLQACSLHTFFELAKANALNLLMIHLPLHQLDELVTRLISPFQCYRDSQALQHLCDALTIRLVNNPDSREINYSLATKHADTWT